MGLRRVWGVALAALAPLALPAGAVAAQVFSPDVEHARAPNGVPAGYARSPGVIGMFPAPLHARSDLNLGGTRNLNDGVSVDSLKPCAPSQVTLLIDARAIPAAQRKGDVIVNGWFDWNREGRWDGSDRCSVDWAIQNVHIPFSALGPNHIRYVPITFPAGAQTDELRLRLTVTLNEQNTSYTGAPDHPYANGESEDYLWRNGTPNAHADAPRASLRRRTGAGNPCAGAPRRSHCFARKAQAGGADFSVSCVPNPAEVQHGGSVKISFQVFDPNGTAPIDGDYSRSQGFSSRWKSTLNRSPNQKGAPPGKVFVDSFTFASRKKHTVPANLVLEKESVSFFFARPGSGSQLVKCAINILHEAKPKDLPKPAPKPKQAPSITLTTPTGQTFTFGSDLTSQANAFNWFQQDWLAFLCRIGALPQDYCKLLPPLPPPPPPPAARPHLQGDGFGPAPSASPASSPAPRAHVAADYTPVGAAPANGQIDFFKVKGMVLRPQGAAPPLATIHLQSLKDNGDGSFTIIQSSQGFELPVGGDPTQASSFVTTFMPTNFCVRQGDILAINTEGGFNSTGGYPSGTPFWIFSNNNNADTGLFVGHNQTMNGNTVKPGQQKNVELLAQYHEVTGAQVAAPCPFPT